MNLRNILEPPCKKAYLAKQSWYLLEFDVATFIEMTVPRVIAFLKTKGVVVEDR